MVSPNERFTNNFDFLRVLAALCIAFSHSYGLLNRSGEEPLMKWTGLKYDASFMGLCIFFTISGYLITKSAANSSSLKNYIWKRFLRIQPLLIVVTLLSVFIVGPLLSSLSPGEYFKQPGTWTYFRNVFPATGIQFVLPGVFETNIKEPGVNGSLWTLVLEERLYIFTAIVFFLSSKTKKYYLWFIALYNLFYFFNTSFHKFTDFSLLNASAGFYSLIFLNAGALYLLGLKQEVLNFKKTLIILPLLVLSLIFPFLNFLQLFIIPFFLMNLAFLRSFTNRAGKWGDFTYGIYIFAFPVQQTIIHLYSNEISPLKLFCFTLLICVPLAVLSWHLLEKKMLKMKSRVI